MFLRLCVIVLAALLLQAGPSSDISGTWRLDIVRSVWGTRPKPVSVTLQVQHKEPALVYGGVVIYSGEDARPFQFNGAIDGKAYPMSRSFGTGSVVLRRLDPLTFESIFTTADRTSVETTSTRVSPDGKTLTRHIRLKAGNSTTLSTEVYRRN